MILQEFRYLRSPLLQEGFAGHGHGSGYGYFDFSEVFHPVFDLSVHLGKLVLMCDLILDFILDNRYFFICFPAHLVNSLFDMFYPEST